ncbi:MAG: hypothetical protein EXS60_02185 [Candidatus Pacebacteria bacterium]|nr:hypothetical protein [Candidatus Paceibacterota bacterium]
MHNHLENATKRRQLIWLSAASTILIVMLWIFYMQRTFNPTPKDTAVTQTDSVSVFENGLSTIGDTVMTGLVNSYLYFHTVASQEKTFTITK